MSSNAFERFYTTDVSVISFKIDDYTGDAQTSILGTLKADVQPYSGDKAREEYGVEIECQKRMFCAESADIDVKNHIKIDGVIYEITHIARWELGLEVMLNKTRLKENDI